MRNRTVPFSRPSPLVPSAAPRPGWPRRALAAAARMLGTGRRAGADERTAAVIRLAADWYWETDAEHRITQVLRAPDYRLAARQELVGTRLWERPGVDAGDLQWQRYRQCLERRQAFHDLQLSQADAGGAMRHARLSGEPVFGPRGQFRGYRGIANDLTAQRETERALNASEAQLAAIIDSSMDAIVTVDTHGRIVLFNATASLMFSCSRADALGAPIERLLPQAMQFIAPPADGAVPSPAPRVLARARPLAARRANGEEFTAEASISRIDLGGRVLYALQLRDLSPRLAAEEERRALELQLRQSQKMEALGTLAGGIAHDFNNIVAAILGNAALAAAQLDEPGNARPFVAEISKAGLRARDVVQRIMAFSRKQAAVFTCQPLQPLVEEGVQLLRAMLPSGIEVVHDIPAEPMLVRADATQISQVLMNLGTNAWQALGSQPGRIVVTLDRDGELARLSVCDSGCGMDEATMQRIFEPFFTTKAKGEGTGLGLPVVHGIVHAHGGHIAVQSRKGEGTTFVIRLPLVAAAAVAPEQEAACQAAAPVAGGGRHVVYLDDYPAMVFMMKATLESLGYRVTGFEDATAALAYLDEHAGEVDLVVTDYNMPRHSGLELAERTRGLRPELPVILASGYITDELRQEAAAIGVHHLFDKPRGIEDLCALIGRVLAPQEACATEQAA